MEGLQGRRRYEQIQIPEQFRPSSAKMRLELSNPRSKEMSISTPKFNGSLASESAAGLSSIDFMEGGGEKLIFKPRILDGQPVTRPLQYRLAHVTDAGADVDYPTDPFIHSSIRPRKWTSELQAVENINDAISASYVNNFQKENTTGVNTARTYSNFVSLMYTSTALWDPTAASSQVTLGRSVHTIEFFCLASETKVHELHATFVSRDSLDKMEINVHVGDFYMEAGKMYRICPYFLAEDRTDETDGTEDVKDAQVKMQSYHGTPEKQREQFFKQKTVLQAGMGFNREVMQKLQWNTSLSTFKGQVFVSQYGFVPYDADDATENDFYNFVTPHISVNDGYANYISDFKMISKTLKLNDVMQYRLQLSDYAVAGQMVRRGGDTETVSNVVQTVRRDLTRAIQERRGLHLHKLNDVLFVGVNSGQNAERLVADSTQVDQPTNENIMLTSDSRIISSDTDVMQVGNNNLLFTFNCHLHNPLHKFLEKVEASNPLVLGGSCSGAPITCHFTVLESNIVPKRG